MSDSPRIALVRKDLESVAESVAGERAHTGPAYRPLIYLEEGRPFQLIVTIVFIGGSTGYKAEDAHRLHVAAVEAAHRHGYEDAFVVVTS